jgi:hypothetical protein
LQKAEEEAAKVYEEFVEAFASDDVQKPAPARSTAGSKQPFVRGGTVMPGQRSEEGKEAG